MGAKTESSVKKFFGGGRALRGVPTLILAKTGVTLSVYTAKCGSRVINGFNIWVREGLRVNLQKQKKIVANILEYPDMAGFYFRFYLLLG